MRPVIWGICAALLLAVPAAADPPTKPATSFQKAKKIARETIYADHRTTFYCGCAYTPNQTGTSGVIDHASCGYEIKHIESRANRLEWEHVMPAARFGRGRDCYEQREMFPKCFKANGKLRSRRECCQKVDAGFKTAHNDLHNLTPSVGEVNADRSALPYGIVEDEPREYGSCDFEIGEEPKVAEPAEAVRGDVARIWLYMAETHGVALTVEERGMFERWAEADPVSNWERERDELIESQQGSRNRLIRP